MVPGISVRDASGITVLDFAEGGCHPANDTELTMLARIAELEEALRRLRDATLHPDNLLRGGEVRGALDNAEKLLST